MSVVYALLDPRSARVRYVGKTTMAVEMRIKMHRWHAARVQKTPVARWLHGLSVSPLVLVLEEDLADLDAAERRWIAFYRGLYGDLLNVSKGGGSGPHSAETRAKMSATRRGVPKSPEHVAKFAASQRGKKRKPYGPAHSEFVRQLHTGRKRSPETRKRLSEAAKRRWQRPDYQEHQREARERRYA